jgi:Mn2+/Fe2+ NRAMP family transporter
MLPFALLPTIAFSSDKRIMGDFVNGVAAKVIGGIITWLHNVFLSPILFRS